MFGTLLGQLGNVFEDAHSFVDASLGFLDYNKSSNSFTIALLRLDVEKRCDRRDSKQTQVL